MCPEEVINIKSIVDLSFFLFFFKVTIVVTKKVFLWVPLMFMNVKCENLPYHASGGWPHGSFRVGYERIWRKAHNITELISLQQPRGPSMETWIKGSVRWLFTFLSLFLRHRALCSQSIHYLSSYCFFLFSQLMKCIGKYQKKKTEKKRKTRKLTNDKGHNNQRLVPPALVPRSRNMFFFFSSSAGL